MKPADLGWHAISGEELLGSLRRVEAGEKADLVYAELCANAEIEEVDRDTDYTKDDEEGGE